MSHQISETMSRQRYEPVPQRDEVIILDNIHNYNYNSALPNSAAPSISESNQSIRTPSIISPSIPNSPPPSFHTLSSPGTPRPTPSTSTHRTGAELWGVAPSTISGIETETEIGTGIGGTSNDALATIAGLKQRIEWLEESIGKLLIEKDSHICNAAPQASLRPSNNRDNCCVTFTDASPDLERLLTQGTGSNCCVTFRRNDGKHANKRAGMIMCFGGLFMLCVMVTIVLTAGAARGGEARGKANMSSNWKPMYDEERN